jgi:hypothetical protein
MRRNFLFLALLWALSAAAPAADETIRGVLEKTAKPGACAQITDALSEVYYVARTAEAEQLIAPFVGKNIKVAITGTVETRDEIYFFNLKSIEKYAKEQPAGDKSATAPPAEKK